MMDQDEFLAEIAASEKAGKVSIRIITMAEDVIDDILADGYQYTWYPYLATHRVDLRRAAVHYLKELVLEYGGWKQSVDPDSFLRIIVIGAFSKWVRERKQAELLADARFVYGQP